MKKQFLFFTLLILIFSCSDKEETYIPEDTSETSPVVFNSEIPPLNNLSDYNFFKNDLKDLSPQFGVLLYEPINSLFTDYAHKKRFVWMPENTQATFVNDFSLLNFPIGTVLIKNFYYDTIQPDNTTRIIETRLIYKSSEGWKFAEYVWNDAQTEAILDLTGSTTEISFFNGGTVKNTSYRIPSEAECFTCHKSGPNAIPIGLKPQNINSTISYGTTQKNQLDKWVEMGYLNANLANNANKVVNWENTTENISNRIRSYLDINCAHCHSDNRHCSYRPIRLAFGDYVDETSLGVCVDPETTISPYSKIVEPGNVARSIMHFRISTTDEEYRMPLLGRTLVHEEGVALVEEWISSLTTVCN